MNYRNFVSFLCLLFVKPKISTWVILATSSFVSLHILKRPRIFIQSSSPLDKVREARGIQSNRIVRKIRCNKMYILSDLAQQNVLEQTGKRKRLDKPGHL